MKNEYMFWLKSVKCLVYKKHLELTLALNKATVCFSHRGICIMAFNCEIEIVGGRGWLVSEQFSKHLTYVIWLSVVFHLK